MKNLIGFIIFCFAAGATAQQQSFEIIFGESSYHQYADIIEINNAYIIAGDAINFSSGNSHGLLIKINNQGLIVDTLYTSIPNKTLGYNTLLESKDSSLIVAGISRPNQNNDVNNLLEIRRYSANFELIDSNSINLGNQYKVNMLYMAEGINGSIYLDVGVKDIQYETSQTMLIKFDRNLDTLNTKMGSILDYYDQIVIPNDTTIMVLDFTGYYSMFDTNLNLGNKYPFSNDNSHITGPFGINQNTDSSFYIAANFGSIDPYVFAGFQTWKQNSLTDTTKVKNHKWVRDPLFYSYPAWFGALDFNNTDSIYVGGIDALGNATNYYTILHYDSCLNLRWERFIGGDNIYGMAKILATSDGGLLTLGIIKNAPDYTGFVGDLHIVKYNHLFVSSTENFVKVYEAIVYPNPGIEHITIRISRQYKQANFSLFSVNGELILSQNLVGPVTQINTSLLQSGSYIYWIQNSDGLSESGVWIKN